MRRFRTLVLSLTCALLPFAQVSSADQPEGVPARWKPVEIRYSYTAFTTAYECDAFESKLRRILIALGSHPNTKVQASGCTANRIARNFFVTVTTATPVPATDEVSSADKSRQELLRKLGVADASMSAPFTATWEEIDLSANRRLDLQPGDCELMEGLRDYVLPKLSLTVVDDKVRCIPKQLDILTPKLVVSALVPSDIDEREARP